MAKRRKKLKQKILTYSDIERRLLRHQKKHRNAPRRPPCTLYGGVTVSSAGTLVNGYEIRWFGNLRRAGGPDEVRFVTLATVYSMSDGDTGYVVHGVGKPRNNSRLERACIKVWRRYVGVFTPHDPKHRLTGSDHVGYRVTSTGVLGQQPVVFSNKEHRIPGSWATLPAVTRPDTKHWRGGHNNWTKLYPKFQARSVRFAADLRKRLADGPMAVVQLLHGGEGLYAARLSLQVCLPPTRTKDGRRLVVSAAMHSDESRAFHHVDGDYSPRHSQYFAYENGRTVARWKCGKDALNGVVEWVLGSIHIPGPEA
jgi:hypothetical protein